MSMIMMLESISAKDVTSQRPAQVTSVGTLKLWAPDAETLDEGANVDDPSYSDDAGSAEHLEAEASLCLEKAWHGLHYLLTGDAWGGAGWSAFLLCGGAEQGEDLGYGPARVFDREEVEEIRRVLTGLTPDELWSRFAPQPMA